MRPVHQFAKHQNLTYITNRYTTSNNITIMIADDMLLGSAQPKSFIPTSSSAPHTNTSEGKSPRSKSTKTLGLAYEGHPTSRLLPNAMLMSYRQPVMMVDHLLPAAAAPDDRFALVVPKVPSRQQYHRHPTLTLAMLNVVKR